MKRCHSLFAFALAAVLLVAGCAQQPAAPPDTRAADEAALRAADIAWSKNAETKNVDGHVAYYTSDAILMPPNEPLATGSEAIRKTMAGLFGLPGMSVKWQPTKVEVARSGDLGYTQGTYEMTFNDPSGKPINDRGKYLEVWRKQPDGSWKCAVDTFTSDLPAAPAPPTPSK